MNLASLMIPATPDNEAKLAAEAFTQFKHLLLPVTDKNPYLSEGTRQVIAFFFF